MTEEQQEAHKFASIRSVSEGIEGLRRELKLTWNAHDREHQQHETAHGRERNLA